MSTRIYRDVILTQGDPLMVKVWDHTPWIINTKFGGFGPEDELYNMHKWCTIRFGPYWPGQANWHVGGVCVDGWGWIGFHTMEMAGLFVVAFPHHTKPIEP